MDKNPLWTSAWSLGSLQFLNPQQSSAAMLETGVFIFFSLSRTSQFPSFPSATLRVGKKAVEVGGECPYLTEEVSITDWSVSWVRPERNCFICPCFRFSICNQKIMEPSLLPTHLSDTREQINWGQIGVWQSALLRIGARINKDVSWMSDFNKKYHSPLSWPSAYLKLLNIEWFFSLPSCYYCFKFL